MSGIVDSLMEVMGSQAFMGGLWLALLGAAGGALVLLGRKLTDLFSRYFIVRATVSNTEDAFEWIVVWLASQKNVLSSKKLKLTTKKDDRHTVQRAGDSGGGQLQLLPGNGAHLFPFKGKLVWMHRTAGKRVTTGWEQTPQEFETISLSTYSRSADIIRDLFETARRYAESLNSDKTRIFTLSPGAYRWLCAMAKPPRSLDSVILDTNVADRVVRDVEDFFARKTWYEERGIPYRRGYLLYGPPGCGKTSFTTALAGKLGLTICVLTLSDKRISDAKLNVRLHETPERSIILLEDVDAIFVQRETADRGSVGVTFSGLLNALDGVASQENRLLFMTTNHVEKLDPALIRPGRCDVHIKFDYASPAQMRGLFLKFFAGRTAEADLFAQRLAGTHLPMAAMQGYLMKRRDSVEQALNQTEELLSQQSSGVSVGSMEIGTWLTRLGLEEYYDGFARAQVFTVQDIPSNLEALGVKVLGHRKRITSMLAGRSDVKEQFAFASTSRAEAVFLQSFGGDDIEGSRGVADKARAFADQLPAHTVSVAQVLKHCAVYRDDPAAACAPEAVNQLLERCRKRFGRGAEGNIAMSLVDVAGARQFDSMRVGDWLRRLGLAKHVRSATEHELYTVSDLRQHKDGLAALGISDAQEVKLVKDMLDADTNAVAGFQLVTTSDGVQEVFRSVFPASDPARNLAQAFGDAVLATSGPDVSVAQLTAFCRAHRSRDLVGRPSIDPHGERAVACATDVKAAPQLPSEAPRMRVLLQRLGLAPLGPKFWKAGVHDVSGLQMNGAWLDGNTVADTFELATQRADAILIADAVQCLPVPMALYAIANNRARVEAAFDCVFDTPSRSDAARRTFVGSVPTGRFSVGELVAHCRRHCDGAETKAASGDGAGDAKAEEGEAVAKDTTGDAAAAAVPQLLNPPAPDASAAGDGDAGEAEAKGTEGNAAGDDDDADVDLVPWLTEHGLRECAAPLLEEGFNDASLLKDVTDDELKEMGIELMGVRVRLLAAAKSLQ